MADTMSPLQQILLTANKLTGNAHTWWSTMKRQGEAASIRTFDDMKRALIEEFTPPEHEQTIRRLLSKHQQTKSVVDYNVRFNQLLQQVPFMSFEEQKYFYLSGLRGDIQRFVSSGELNLANLKTMQRAAIRQDNGSRTKSTKGLEVEAHATDTKKWKKDQKGKPTGKPRPERKPTGKFPCFICKAEKPDHWPSKCPEWASYEAAKKKQDAAPAPEANFTHVEANLTLATDKLSEYSVAVDSAATHHIIKDKFLIEDYRPFKNKIAVRGGKKGSAPAIGYGTGKLTIYNKEDETKSVIFKDVIYAPDYVRNLVSTQAMNPIYGATLEGNTSPYTGIHDVKTRQKILNIRTNGGLPFIVGFTETTPEAFASEVLAEDPPPDAASTDDALSNQESVKESTGTSKNYVNGTSASAIQESKHSTKQIYFTA